MRKKMGLTKAATEKTARSAARPAARKAAKKTTNTKTAKQRRASAARGEARTVAA